MNELWKSGIMAALAVVATVVAATFRPAEIRVPQTAIGERLFEDLTDPVAAQRLEVAEFDTTSREVKRLEIANEGGEWVLASHKNYPADAADAEKRIRDIALNLMNLQVLDVATDLPSEHEQFGVVEPNTEEVSQGQEGVGLMVTLETEGEKKLAQLIIGKEVMGAEGQRFVRKPGQDRVYIAKVDRADLSSSFDDWIEADLLKVNQFDIREVSLKDYNFDQQIGIQEGRLVALPKLDQRFEIDARWSPEESKWELKEFLQNQGGRLVPSELLESEELNREKLDELKRALTELKIIDVVPKPEGLQANLQLDEQTLSQPEVAQSLMQHGFFPVRTQNRAIEVFSSNGELRVLDKDGIEYVLRFGQTAGIEEKEGETKLNRYLLVSARVNEEAIPQPELQAVPAAGEEPAVTEESATENDAAAAETAATETAATETAETETAATETAATETAATETAEPAEVEQPAEGETAESEPAAEASEADATATESAPAEKDAGAAEREKIEKENQRKIDEYNEKVEKAKQRVEELNDRFGQWYYVISEDVYKKLHLNRFDLIKEKEGASGSFGIGDFRSLEQGLEAPGTQQAPPTEQ